MIKAGANRVFRRAKGLPPAGSPAPAYQGPLDLVPGAVAAYGQRLLRAAYAGSIYTIRRSSDNTEQAFAADVSGDAPVSSISAFIGGSSGYVSTWNDQTGNGADLQPPNAGSQPQWVANGPNSHPYLGMGSAGNSYLDALASIAFLTGYHSFDVIQIHVAGQASFNNLSGGNAYIASTLHGTRNVRTEAYSDNGIDYFDQITTSAVAALDAFLLLETHITANSLALYANGAFLTLNDNGGGDNVFSGAANVLLNMDNSGVGAQVRRVESLFYDSITAPNIVTLRQNIATYYGITL